MKRTLLDDMNVCARILCEAEGETVTIGDETFLASISDESTQTVFSDEGGAEEGSSLRVMVAERSDLRALIGKTAVVRGKEYYVSGCSYSGADNEFNLIAASDQ